MQLAGIMLRIPWFIFIKLFCFSMCRVFFFLSLTIKIYDSPVTSEYFPGLMILGAREVPFQPMEIQSCVWYSLTIPRHILCQNLNWHWYWAFLVSWTAPRHQSPVFEVFVIAVYLPSLRCKNFLGSKCEREAGPSFPVVFPTLSSTLTGHPQLK